MGIVIDEDKELLNRRMITDKTEANVIVHGDDGDNTDTIKATVLFPKKKDVKRINDSELQRSLQNNVQHVVHQSEDECYKKTHNGRIRSSLTKIHLDILNKCLNVVNTLVLAVGAQVMLVKNLDVTEGLVNGSRGVVAGSDHLDKR
jgi:hypothetical protein